MSAVPIARCPERTCPNVREIHEQSMKLGNYPTVLTLLWIRHIETSCAAEEDDEHEELDPEQFTLGQPTLAEEITPLRTALVDLP